MKLEAKLKKKLKEIIVEKEKATKFCLNIQCAVE